MQIIFTPISYNQVYSLSYEARIFLEQAANRPPASEIDAIEAMTMVAKGDALLFTIEVDEVLNGIFFVVFGKTADGKIMNISMLGGKNMKLWKDQFYDYCVSFAKEAGCAEIVLMTSLAIGRIFPSLKLVGGIFSLKI